MFILLNSRAQQQFQIIANPELTKNASAFVHDEHVNLNFISQRKLIYHHKAGITVFNESAAHFGDLLMSYDKNTKTINLSDLPSGIYIANIFDEDNILRGTKKVIKK